MPSSYSLPRLVEEEIDALIKAGYYSSKSDVVKDAMRTLLVTKVNLRIAAAVEIYKDGNASLGKAAEIAGMSAAEFKEVLVSHGVKIKVKIEKSDMKKSDELMKKMR